MSWNTLLPWIMWGIAGGIAFLVNPSAARRASGDSGAFWSAVAIRTGWLAVLAAASTASQSVDFIWKSGVHLDFDLVVNSWWAYPLALALPFALWGVLLAVCLSSPTSKPELRGLAGGVRTGSRTWVSLFILAFVVPLFWVGRTRLGLGEDGYPAFTWGTMAVLSVSLLAVALSSGKEVPFALPAAAPSAGQQPVPQLTPWPDLMRSSGIRLEEAATFAQTPTRPIHARAADFADRLSAAGAVGVAPEVIEAVHELTSPSSPGADRASYRLLYGPDGAGQLEAVALAASDLAISRQECTLVITPRGHAWLERQLTRWLPKPNDQDAVKPGVLPVVAGVDLTGPAGIWLVDATTLSDHLMVRLAEPAVGMRIGMVVWWDVHEYTGVLAANVWAISRRLHRLITGRGRPDVRTLVLVRDAFHPEAQLSSYVRRLLPYPIDAERETRVETNYFPRRVHLHVLRGHQDYFRFNPGSSVGGPLRHPALVAGTVSAGGGWPTAIGPTDDITGAERTTAMAVQNMATRALDTAAESGAYIAHVDESSVLSLAEVFGQGGRASPVGLPHYVGFTISANPYVEYLVTHWQGGSPVPAARRLLGAEGHPAIFRRHLLLALSEQEDTRTGLMETLLWQEETVSKTLDEIAGQRRLSRRQVAFVAEGVRKIEYLYRSTMAADPQPRPLDTVDDRLVLVRPEVEGGSVPLRVDRSRLAISAYPGRVFVANGVRYAIRDWDEAGRDWVNCAREDRYAATWRKRTTKVLNLERAGDERAMNMQGQVLRQFPVRLRYQEDVTGYLRRDYAARTGNWEEQVIHLPAPLSAEFDTMGFVLQLVPEPQSAAILALCQALRHVLPVHLGVEEDAMEVVPLETDYIDRQPVFGLAIVDLYPGGIGLVDALAGDPLWIPNVLRCARDWLEDAGSKNAFRSPLARASTGGGEQPGPALELLRCVTRAEVAGAAAKARSI